MLDFCIGQYVIINNLFSNNGTLCPSLWIFQVIGSRFLEYGVLSHHCFAKLYWINQSLLYLLTSHKPWLINSNILIIKTTGLTWHPILINGLSWISVINWNCVSHKAVMYLIFGFLWLYLWWYINHDNEFSISPG